MNRLPEAALQWWDGRTVRERRLLAAMVVLIAATALWFAIVRPALAWRDEADGRRERAAATAAEARRDLLRLTGRRGGGGGAPPGGLEPLVNRTAEAAGLAPALAMDADGGLGFRIASAGSGAALAWVAQLETDHGLQVCRLGVVENADATVQVEGSLAAGACPVPGD